MAFVCACVCVKLKKHLTAISFALLKLIIFLFVYGKCATVVDVIHFSLD